MPLPALQFAAPSERHAANEKKKGGVKPPTCRKCGTPMEWTHTDLKRENQSRLVHTFYCPACSEIARVEESWHARLRV